MIVGLGVDLLDVSRVRAELSRQDGDLSHLFTPPEIDQCSGQGDPTADLAVRFAAKEAIVKALGGDSQSGLPWREIEIRSGRDGRLHATLHGGVAELADRRGVARIHLSSTSTAGVAVASAVLEASP